MPTRTRTSVRGCGPALVAIALLAAASGPASAEVTVASIGPLSTFRPYAAAGIMRGTELMQELVNGGSGLLSQRLRNMPIDDGCNPVQGVAATQLAIANHVRLVMGGACSTAAADISQRLAAAKILQIVPNAPLKSVRDAAIATIFHMTPRPDHEGIFAASLLAKRWPDRPIAVADDGEAVWHESAAALVAELAQRGVTPALVTGFKANQHGYPELVAALRQSRAEILFASGLPIDLGVIVRDVRTAGLDIQIVTGRNGKVDVFQQTAGAAAEGVLAAERRDWVAHALADPVLAGEKARGGDINVYVATGYTTLKIWSEAVAAAQSFEAEPVARAIKSRRFATPFGDLAFDENGDLTADSEDWVWYRWHDGLAQMVE